MKVRIHWTCQPKNKKSGYEAEMIFFDTNLPFIPSIGTFIKVHEKGDYGTVDDIFIDANVVDGPVRIYLTDPDGLSFRPWEEMRKQGWRLDDGVTP